MCATFVVFKNLPIVNCHSRGENSPNLVTLIQIGNVDVSAKNTD
jgi:hypothetical protein